MRVSRAFLVIVSLWLTCVPLYGIGITCAATGETVIVAVDDVVYADPPAPGTALPPIAVLANDIIPTGTTVTISIVPDMGQHSGTATAGSGSITYTPNGALVADTFIYRITTIGGVTSDAAVKIYPRDTVQVTGSCNGIGCLFDAKPSNPAGIRNVVWNYGDGKESAGGVRTYWEYPVEKQYVVTATINYYSGATIRGSYTFQHKLARSIAWPVTASGLSASVKITYADLQSFPEGASGLTPYLWWSDYAKPNSTEPDPASGEPRNVTIWQDIGQDVQPFLGCDTLPECRLGTTYAHGRSYKLRLQLRSRTTGAVLYEYSKYVTVENAAPVPRFGYLRSGRHYFFTIPPPVTDPATAWDIDEIPRDWLWSQLRPNPYEWDFGDGSTWSTSDPADIHQLYPITGDYKVTLKVTDADGAAGYVSDTIKVRNTPPAPNLVFNCRGRACRFTYEGSADDSSITRALWDYGDGSPATSDYLHTYANPGCYTVTMTLTDDDGVSTQVRRTIVVADGPNVAAGKLVVDAKAGAYSTYGTADSDADRVTTGNLNGILEPGEIVVVEPAWSTSNTNMAGQLSDWSSSPPLTTGPGLAATRYNNRQLGAYDFAGNIANCWKVNGCHVIGVTPAGTRTTRHVDVNWTERATLGLPDPRIIASSPAFGPEWGAQNVFDDNPNTDYCALGTGADTFIDFDYGLPARIFEATVTDRRASPQGVASSSVNNVTAFNLIFSTDAVFGNADDVVVPVQSPGVGDTVTTKLNGTTGIVARYIRYDVVSFSAYAHVGASEISFRAKGEYGQPDTFDYPVSVHVGSTFIDVPPGSPYYAAVEALAHWGVTNGCGANQFCTGTATRRDAGVLLMRARSAKSGAQPPACTSAPFTDVPCTDYAAPYILQMKNLGITSGCGSNLFCPDAPIKRSELAVWLVSAMGISPQPCEQTFADVQCVATSTTPKYWAADFISELYRRGITNGCSANPLSFCPDDLHTRETLAPQLVAAFGLQIAYPQCAASAVISPAVSTAKATIVDSTPAYSAEWSPSFAVDGNPNTDYASNGAGTKTFIDFDFGRTVPIVEVLYTDRRSAGGTNGSGSLGSGDAVSQYDLIFSADRNFGSPDDTLVRVQTLGTCCDTTPTLTNGGLGVSARYMRWQVRLMKNGGKNAGAGEFTFKIGN